MLKIYNILLMLGQGIFIAYDITYFREAGLSLALITLASTGFDISSSIMEIPTSLFFDRVSPRLTLALGNMLRLCGFLLFAFNPQNFWVVLVGQVLTGIGSATESGAASALYINERKEDESSFEKIMGEIQEFGSITYLVGGLVGAVAYRLSEKLIWLLPALIYVLATILLVKMPMNNTVNTVSSNAVRVRTLAREFMHIGAKTFKNIDWWMLLLVETGSLSMYLLWQVRLSGADTTQVWNQFAGLVVMNSAGYIAGKLSQKISLAHSFRLLSVIIINVVLCLALAWTTGFWVGIILYLPHVILLGWIQNMYAGALHMSISDNERATVFSLQAAVVACAAIIVGPACGWLTDSYGLGVGMTSTLFFFLIPIIHEIMRALRDKRKK